MCTNHLSFLPLSVLVLLLAGCTADDIFETDEILPDGSTSPSTLTDPGLAWSESAFEASIGTANLFPTLLNNYGLEITYSSSDTKVATIDEEGVITLVSAGTTAIMATSAATST